ncbi:hypothetical protein [Desulfurococcus amylolyticus]|uniref:hypothetical protein n=1 Tax=Desulfurococcus amylolyticus TaxID=94694 RepID=UPI0012FF04DF|nr:hypothetical protein [Desulfurococcus amylolyticus]
MSWMLAEVTIRWPGHISATKLLRYPGFMDGNKVDVKDVKLKPIEFTSRMLEAKLSIPVRDMAVLYLVTSRADGWITAESPALKGGEEVS